MVDRWHFSWVLAQQLQGEEIARWRVETQEATATGRRRWLVYDVTRRRSIMNRRRRPASNTSLTDRPPTSVYMCVLPSPTANNEWSLAVLTNLPATVMSRAAEICWQRCRIWKILSPLSGRNFFERYCRRIRGSAAKPAKSYVAYCA